jgi:hypothetical protein
LVASGADRHARERIRSIPGRGWAVLPVRFFLLEALVLLALTLAVMAVVFQSQGARHALVMLRNAAWLYIALLFLAGGVEVLRRNL